MEIDETLLRALGLAVQILEELPDHLRPESNIADIQRILSGESSGGDGFIIAQAIATAIAFRALGANGSPLDFSDPERATARLNDRMQEFRSRMQEFSTLFEAAARCDAWTLAIHFAPALENLRQSLDERNV
jgi:hypothetical protein